MSTVAIKLADLVKSLNKIRENHGEAAYQSAVRDIAIDFILKENGEAFLKNAFPDLDLDQIRREAEAKYAVPTGSPEDILRQAVQMQMPSVTTQAHLNTVMAAFDTLRTTLDAYFRGDAEKAKKARDALDKTLTMAAQIREIADKVQELPEDQRSKAAQEFVTPPKEFHEYDRQRQFLIELAGVVTSDELSDWYQNSREAMNTIVSQTLRNELFDAIRAKRIELEKSAPHEF